MVTRAISPDVLDTFFASAGLGSEAPVSMHHRDGALLARFPHVEELIGQNFKTGSADQQAVFNRPFLTTRLNSPVDGKDRLLASRRLTLEPLIVVATETVDATLAAWRTQTEFFIGMAAAALTAIGAILYLVFRQMTRRLSLEKLRLDTAINNMSQGLLLFDSSERPDRLQQKIT
uniref:hypothetical protein n=1 Tax=Bradyrhizobium altum TaxID=1571202 RepID=UPI0035DCBFAA